MSAPAYLTAAQLAGLLQVSQATAYRWADEDPTMPVLRVGGVVRFPRERILRWLDARTSGRRRRSSPPIAGLTGSSESAVTSEEM
ncbi:MAG: helix-turn-helix domain-containing protein [Gemmatimonadetes bacterium]|nr:helix-turn-helix domain-containing protein [Gemmatimonadota bacterium]